MEWKGHGRARNEHESGLDEVPEPKAIPGMMKELLKENLYKESIAALKKVIKQVRAFNYQQHHNEPPHKIEGKQTLTAKGCFAHESGKYSDSR